MVVHSRPWRARRTPGSRRWNTRSRSCAPVWSGSRVGAAALAAPGNAPPIGATGTHPSPRKPAAPKKEPISFEDLLGGRILAWVGGAAVVLGVVFFLVMAASRGWIDKPTRVLLAVVGSTALLGVGLYLHERQGRTQAALAAVATAIAALYVTLVAATQLYDLIDPVLGLVVRGVDRGDGHGDRRALERADRGRDRDRRCAARAGADRRRHGPASLAFMAIALVAAVGVLLWQRWSWLASPRSSSARRSSVCGCTTSTTSGSASRWPCSRRSGSLRRRRGRLRAPRPDDEAAHPLSALLLANAALSQALAGASSTTRDTRRATAWVSGWPRCISAAVYPRTAAG